MSTFEADLEAAAQTTAFGPLVIRFDQRVLEPRSWTLLQSRWAAELAADAADGPILELCAGAGQIGLAAAVLSGRSLVQVEADPVAAAYARINAAAAGREASVEVRQTRMESALDYHERFPIILADPPYLPSAEIGRWPEDPVRAIDGGPDGLDLIRLCLDVAQRHLSEDGDLLLQVAGATQAQFVVDLPRRSPELRFAYRGIRCCDDERAVLWFSRRTAPPTRPSTPPTPPGR